MREMQTRGIAESSDALPALALRHNERAAVRPPPHPASSEVVSVEIFDHGALARINEIRPVFAMNVTVFAQ